MRKIKNLIIGSLVLGFFSCKKYLDVSPDNRTEINSIDKVAQLVGAAYPSYDYYSFSEAASDNSEDKGYNSGDPSNLLTAYYKWEDYLDGGTNSTDTYWNGCYEAIASANHALDAIEKNNFGDGVLPYKGEALVARAYAHHMLALFFAKPYKKGGDNSSPGIPYVTTQETILLAGYKRGTVQEDYDNIERDLEAGIKLLSANAYKVPKYHFTPVAARAFASRFYLWKGDWQKVIDNVNAMFASSGELVNNLRPISTTFKSWTDAEFFFNFSKSDVKATLLLASCTSTFQFYFKPRFGFGDKMTKMFVDKNVTGKKVENKPRSYGSPHWTTYKWPNKSNLQAILLTVDEALMNRAEAYAQLGQYDLALKDLSTFYSVRIQGYNPVSDAVTAEKVNKFFGISDLKQGIITAILEAKKAEYLQEGMRWMDIIRGDLTVTKNLFNEQLVDSTIVLKPNDLRRQFQLPLSSKLAGLEPNPR